MTERAEFVRGFIETLQDNGYSHEQCKVAAEIVGNLAEAAGPEGFKEFVQLSRDGKIKEATDKLASFQLSSVLSPIKDLGIAGLSAGANVAGDVARGLIQAGPAAATLGVVAPAAMGYGVGHAAAGLFDDPDKVISEAKHRELVSRLLENARQLRQRTNREQQSDNEQVSGLY